MDKERVAEISRLIDSEGIPFDRTTEAELYKRAVAKGIGAAEAAEYAHEETWEMYLREYHKDFTAEH